MRVVRNRSLAFVLLLAPCASDAPPVRAQDLETQVRVDYLYNFARYFEWPPAAFPSADTPIRICAQAPDGFADALERAVAGETINGRRLEAVRVRPRAQARGCHLFYVSARNGGRVAAALRPLRGRPLVTVGEGDRFLERGGMIRFRRIGNRLRFDINLRAVQRSGLNVSAGLLSVAAEVKREWHP